MSKVDLSLAKAGDVVHFRCGGNAKIYEIKRYEPSVKTENYEIQFNDANDIEHYFGVKGFAREMNGIFDIIKVESK